MSTFDREGIWSKKAWINDFVSPKLASDLTTIYADDVIQAVEDNEFSTLKAAIDDLSLRVGLSSLQVDGIRRCAYLKTNPRLVIAVANIKRLSAEQIMQAIEVYENKCDKCSNAPCSCGLGMSKTMKQAIEEVGIDTLEKKLSFVNYLMKRKASGDSPITAETISDNLKGSTVLTSSDGEKIIVFNSNDPEIAESIPGDCRILINTSGLDAGSLAISVISAKTGDESSSNGDVEELTIPTTVEETMDTEYSIEEGRDTSSPPSTKTPMDAKAIAGLVKKWINLNAKRIEVWADNLEGGASPAETEEYASANGPMTKTAMASVQEIIEIWNNAPKSTIITIDAYTKGGGYIKGVGKTPPHVKVGELLRRGVPGKMGGEISGTGYGKPGDTAVQDKINGYSMLCAANCTSIVDDAERELALKRCFRSYLIKNIIRIKYGSKIWDFRVDPTEDPQDSDDPTKTLNHEEGGSIIIDLNSDEPFPEGYTVPTEENRWKAPSSHKHWKDLTEEERKKILDEENAKYEAEEAEKQKKYEEEEAAAFNKPQDEGGAAASARSIYLQKISAKTDWNEVKKIKQEKGCSQAEAMKEFHKRHKNTEKPEEKESDKDKEDTNKTDDKKEKNMKKGASNKAQWVAFLKKKGWFQGSNEPTQEGKITSNKPEELGYPKEIGYQRPPMAVPVGEDARKWEQNWFEGAADKTQKVMGPSGEELKEKKQFQRATWKAFLSKKGGAECKSCGGELESPQEKARGKCKSCFVKEEKK